MSHACCGGSDGGASRRIAGAAGAADWLALAGSPVFAIMALLTGILGGSDICAAAQAWPFSGMVTMYLLMSAFHSTPWLRLAARLGTGQTRP